MVVSDVSQKYDVILRKFENLKHQHVLAFTVWLIVPITLLFLQNRQFGRFAAKTRNSCVCILVQSGRMSHTPRTVRSMFSLNLAMFVKLVPCHRTEFTKCTKLLLSASYRLTAEYKWHHTTSI